MVNLNTDKMLAEKDGGIGWMIFNNPARRNTTPRPRSPAMADPSKPNSPRISSVCWPSSGVGGRILWGVRLIFSAWPTRRTVPRPGCADMRPAGSPLTSKEAAAKPARERATTR